MWRFMQVCWNRDPAARPTAEQVLSFFGEILEDVEDTRPPPSPHLRPLDNSSALNYADLIREYSN